MGELGSSNGDGGAGVVGMRARRRERGRERAHRREERMTSALGAMAGEGEVVALAGRACGHAASRLLRGRARAALPLRRAGGWRRGACGAGLASPAGPVGWRRPASEQPPFSLFLNLFTKSLNTDLKSFAKLFRIWGKKRKCSP